MQLGLDVTSRFFFCSWLYHLYKQKANMQMSVLIDRETGSCSKLNTFHLKQAVQKMHRFLELYQDFV